MHQASVGRCSGRTCSTGRQDDGSGGAACCITRSENWTNPGTKNPLRTVDARPAPHSLEAPGERVALSKQQAASSLFCHETIGLDLFSKWHQLRLDQKNQIPSREKEWREICSTFRSQFGSENLVLHWVSDWVMLQFGLKVVMC